MAKGISIDILANTRDFQRGVKDVDKALSETADSLNDLTRDADKSGSKIGDGLSDGVQYGTREAERSVDKLTDAIDDSARDADRTGRKIGDGLSDGVKDGTKDSERAVEKLEGSFKDLADGVKRESKSAGSSLGDEVKRGSAEASDGIREVGDEAASTAKEAAASFDGSAESIGDAFQEVAANAFAGFGPAGLIAGVAAAAGIGLVLSALEAGGEETEEYKARVGELTDKFIEAGGQGELSFEQVADSLRKMATEGDDVAGTLADILERADKTGVSVEDLTKAFTGNEEAIDRQINAAKDIIAQYDAMAAAAGEDTSKLDGNLAQRSLWAKTSVKKLEEVRSAVEEAKENERLYLESGADELVAKSERTAEYADSIQGELADVGESWETYQNAETGAIDLAAYTAALSARVEAMNSYRANMSSLHGTISDDAYNYLVQMGADAAPLIDAYVKAPLDQQQATAAVWGTLGRTGGANYNAELQKEIPDSVSGPKVIIPTPDMSPVERAIAQFGTRRINVEANVITKIGQQVY
ncbi:hypothetical protein [Rathayibacter sp. AY1B5]|uniref:hypothetical protein n=1 Tax=Rathayibacter sp. AY1B5 TaxID=2080530 RepID=UPI000CE90B8D|nr:hypothetical protein [Rathayibacter sp. AY1B5]PPI28204.1 hypothetical protein C5D44_00245 [Rathayibacter sp. AY1B5]